MKREADAAVDLPDAKRKAVSVGGEVVWFIEEEEEEEEVNFITAHLNPEAVIWSEQPDLLPLHPGKFYVGWSLDQGDTETPEAPKETMFLVADTQDKTNLISAYKHQVRGFVIRLSCFLTRI